MTQFEQFFWAVQPGGSGTRPVALVNALRHYGLVAPDVQHVYHGTSTGADGWQSAGVFAPGTWPRHRPSARAAAFSPVFALGTLRECAWLDFYDDWSIAPDIHPLHRAYAAITYRAAARLATRGAVVTCNTPYMARRLGINLRQVLPNGVNEDTANLTAGGNSARRLVVQGHFFRGRTDFSLLARVATEGQFDEVIICAPGTDRRVKSVISRIATQAKVYVRPWLTDAELAEFVGERTVALVPHLVNDYTMSQDLMKVYKFLAMGMRVIVPRLLWPASVSSENAFLIDFGTDLASAIPKWVDETSSPSEADRRAFVAVNGWNARARRVAELLEER